MSLINKWARFGLVRARPMPTLTLLFCFVLLHFSFSFSNYKITFYFLQQIKISKFGQLLAMSDFVLTWQIIGCGFTAWTTMQTLEIDIFTLFHENSLKPLGLIKPKFISQYKIITFKISVEAWILTFIRIRHVFLYLMKNRLGMSTGWLADRPLETIQWWHISYKSSVADLPQPSQFPWDEIPPDKTRMR